VASWGGGSERSIEGQLASEHVRVTRSENNMCRRSHNPSHNPAQVSTATTASTSRHIPHNHHPMTSHSSLDHLSTTSQPPCDHLLTIARSRLDDLSTRLYASLIPPLLNLLKVVLLSSNKQWRKDTSS
jgi:hypothetical protein